MAIFSNLADKLSNAFKKFRNKGKLTPADVKEGMREIKLALLEADVNFKVVREFIKTVTDRAVGSEVLESLLPGQQVVKIVHEELINLINVHQVEFCWVKGHDGHTENERCDYLATTAAKSKNALEDTGYINNI